MREIEFRGLNTSGEWVYGSYVSYYEGHHEIHCKIDPEDDFNGYPVNGGTVGQYTGIKDCDGAKIFDGDILSSYHFTDNNRVDHFIEHIVAWSEKFNGWFALHKESMSPDDGSVQLWVYMKGNKSTSKVIGNIHE